MGISAHHQRHVLFISVPIQIVVCFYNLCANSRNVLTTGIEKLTVDIHDHYSLKLRRLCVAVSTGEHAGKSFCARLIHANFRLFPIVE